jgi:Cu-Zn family superoxide dismutase
MNITRHAAFALVVGTTGLIAIGAAPANADGAISGRASGTFTSNPDFVPTETDPLNPTIGAEGSVQLVAGAAGRTIVSLHLQGMPADRSFGAHLHRDRCAAAFGGPHYQAPTGTPAGNADPQHEIWLDVTTNAAGNAQSHAEVPFEVQRGARSVVIHQGEHTLPGGGAGQRLACLDLSV